MMDQYLKGVIDEPTLTSSTSVHKLISSHTHVHTRVCVNCPKSNKRNASDTVIRTSLFVILARYHSANVVFLSPNKYIVLFYFIKFFSIKKYSI